MTGCATRLGTMIYGLGIVGAAVMGGLALWTALFSSGDERFWSACFLAGAAAACFAGSAVRRFFATRTSP